MDVCLHPLAGGQCFAIFAIVSLVYTSIAATYAAGALLVLRPQLSTRRFAIGLLAAPLVTWLSAMLAFTLGGSLGLLTYPHDASPFFYMDWFAAGLTLLLTSAFVGLIWRLPASSGAPAGS